MLLPEAPLGQLKNHDSPTLRLGIRIGDCSNGIGVNWITFAYRTTPRESNKKTKGIALVGKTQITDATPKESYLKAKGNALDFRNRN